MKLQESTDVSRSLEAMLPAHEREELRSRQAARLRQLMEAMADEELRALKRDIEVLSNSKKVTQADLQGRVCALEAKLQEYGARFEEMQVSKKGMRSCQ